MRIRGRGWILAAMAALALLGGTAWAEPRAGVTRQEITAFEQSLQPLVQERQAILADLAQLQETLRDVQPVRGRRDDPEQVLRDLESLRSVNGTLARLEHLVVAAEKIRPSVAALEGPYVELMLVMQHTVTMVRNHHLYKLTGLPGYGQAAAAHRAQAHAARERYMSRMQELKREAGR